MIGTIYFKSLPVDGVSEIGYGMSPQYEGNGYMSEALETMLKYGKENNIKTVIADTMIDNVKSQKVLLRNGFINIETKDNKLLFQKSLK